MALTLTQQMDIIKGVRKPPSNDMKDLVHQAAVNYAFDFNSATIPPGYKVFAIKNTTTPFATINQDATNYVNKILIICQKVFTGDQDTVYSLQRTIVGIIGKSSITNAQVIAADDAAWESTIATHIPRAFELLAGVTKAELANYTTPVTAT